MSQDEMEKIDMLGLIDGINAHRIKPVTFRKLIQVRSKVNGQKRTGCRIGNYEVD